MVILGVWDTSLHQKSRSECKEQASNRGQEAAPCLCPITRPVSLLSPLPEPVQLCPTFAERRKWENTLVAAGTLPWGHWLSNDCALLWT